MSGHNADHLLTKAKSQTNHISQKLAYNVLVSEILLQTKLYIPPSRPSLVPRSHLTQKLNDGLQDKITLVSAPPGFGKTTLVSEWLHQISAERRTAWLSLEESDNDPVRFFTYLIAALQTIDHRFGQELAAAQLPPPVSVISLLINDIAPTSQSFTLVLDDYHLITAPAIHKAVITLLDHMPPQMHLLLISRSDPPFSLSRLRARRQLNEIRARDLRFTQAEALEFLNQTMGLALSPAEVALLERRTEGWIAGLQLAAHSLQLEDDNEAFLNAFAGDDRYIADYLVEEVLTHQPQTITSFLLQTSILSRLSVPLCNVLLEREDSQSIIEFLEQSNLFIIPLDNRRQWYRYHHLFADLLRERLETASWNVTHLHQRAGQWYADNGFFTEAIEHALAAADYGRAIEFILSTVIEMFMTNRLSTLLRWYQQIPTEMAARNTQLIEELFRCGTFCMITLPHKA